MRFGFLIFDGVEELDLLGPWELIGVWSEYVDGPDERMLVWPRNAAPCVAPRPWPSQPY